MVSASWTTQLGSRKDRRHRAVSDISDVKVLSSGTTTAVACQTARCSEQPIACGERTSSPCLKAGAFARIRGKERQMLGGHVYGLLIILIVLVVLIGGALLFVRVAVRTAAREYARVRAEEERRQREQHHEQHQ
jgi:hypothetical protein